MAFFQVKYKNLPRCISWYLTYPGKEAPFLFCLWRSASRVFSKIFSLNGGPRKSSQSFDHFRSDLAIAWWRGMAFRTSESPIWTRQWMIIIFIHHSPIIIQVYIIPYHGGKRNNKQATTGKSKHTTKRWWWLGDGKLMTHPIESFIIQQIMFTSWNPPYYCHPIYNIPTSTCQYIIVSTEYPYIIPYIIHIVSLSATLQHAMSWHPGWRRFWTHVAGILGGGWVRQDDFWVMTSGYHKITLWKTKSLLLKMTIYSWYELIYSLRKWWFSKSC